MTDGLGIVIDWIEQRGFTFECDEDVNDAFKRIDDKWEIVGNRFSITKLLGLNNELPDLMLYLQEQIDDECEDDTEIITFGEDNLDELKRYIESKIILEPENDINTEFENISRILKGDNRPALDKVLRRNKEEFLDFLGSRLSELRDVTKTDEEAGTLERTIEPIERGIDDILQGATNLLGTPIRLLDEIVRPIERPIKIVQEETKGIVNSIKGFLRSLFS